eukprot:3788353-Alexandrium_andersonii.AAC.1
MAYTVDMGLPCPVRVYNVYGWHSALTNIHQRRESMKLFSALEHELTLLGSVPHIVLGDFNAPLELLLPLEERLSTGKLHD